MHPLFKYCVIMAFTMVGGALGALLHPAVPPTYWHDVPINERSLGVNYLPTIEGGMLWATTFAISSFLIWTFFQEMDFWKQTKTRTIRRG